MATGIWALTTAETRAHDLRTSRTQELTNSVPHASTFTVEYTQLQREDFTKGV